MTSRRRWRALEWNRSRDCNLLDEVVHIMLMLHCHLSELALPRKMSEEVQSFAPPAYATEPYAEIHHREDAGQDKQHDPMSGGQHQQQQQMGPGGPRQVDPRGGPVDRRPYYDRRSDDWVSCALVLHRTCLHSSKRAHGRCACCLPQICRLVASRGEPLPTHAQLLRAGLRCVLRYEFRVAHRMP